MEIDSYLKTDYDEYKDKSNTKININTNTFFPKITTENSTRIHTKYSNKLTKNSVNKSLNIKRSVKESEKVNVDLIENEVEHINLKEILNNVDPSFDCQEILNQLYDYENAIKNEIKALKYQFKTEESYVSEIKEDDKIYKLLSKPIVHDYLTEIRVSKDNSNGNHSLLNLNKTTTNNLKTENNLNSSSSKVKMNNKTFTSLLHNEISCLDHNINDIKFENNNLSKQIEEMRKNYIYKFNKLKDLAEEFNLHNNSNLRLKEINLRINQQRSKYY